MLKTGVGEFLFQPLEALEFTARERSAVIYAVDLLGRAPPNLLCVCLADLGKLATAQNFGITSRARFTERVTELGVIAGSLHHRQRDILGGLNLLYGFTDEVNDKLRFRLTDEDIKAARAKNGAAAKAWLRFAFDNSARSRSERRSGSIVPVVPARALRRDFC